MKLKKRKKEKAKVLSMKIVKYENTIFDIPGKSYVFTDFGIK
jgi:hypothetical protein